MTERPILFSGPMVRALLAGTKTQTRRVCKNKVYSNGHHFDGREILCHNDYLPPGAMLMDVKRGKDEYTTSNLEGWDVECPYGQPGDRLWVRETWAKWGRDDQCGEGPATNHEPIYRADGHPWDVHDTWRPSIHMPRAASRITLEVTGVRVERLQDISEADAHAEGCSFECMTPTGQDSGSAIHGPGGYIALWESINGPGSWEANPWVWCVSFRRVMP
jgi:hypothetical protein